MVNSHSLLCLVVFVLLSICIWDALHLEITKPPLGGSDQSWLAALFGRAAICQFAAESLHFPTWWHMIMIIQRREAGFFFKWPDSLGDGKCLMGINIEKLRLSTFSIGARFYHRHKLFNENWFNILPAISCGEVWIPAQARLGLGRQPHLAWLTADIGAGIKRYIFVFVFVVVFGRQPSLTQMTGDIWAKI